MIAPALQPLAANEARLARPVFYQTPSSADSAALKMAIHESPTQTARKVEFIQNAYQAKEGGRVFTFESCAPGDDYVVRELSAADVTRRQQTAIRYRVTELYLHAAKETELARKAKTPGFVRLHHRIAEFARDEARELELRLHVSGVRPAGELADDCEPQFSAERDARVSP